MNKLKFNEGGQPIYLDDLEVLQKLPTEQATGILEPIIEGSKWPTYEYSMGFKQLFPVGTGTLVGCFISLNLASFSKNDTTRICECEFRQGYVYINGELMKYEAVTLSLSYGAPFYVIVKTEYTEQRTLDNGEAAYCRESKRAVLSSSPSITDECYSSEIIGDLMDSIYNQTWIRIRKAARNWTTISFTGSYSFTGTIKYCAMPDGYRFSISLSATSTEVIDSDLPLGTGAFPGTYWESPMLVSNGIFFTLRKIENTLYFIRALKTDKVTPNKIHISTTFDVPIESA